ncbi:MULTISPECIES: transglycosylase SLT domain-containing protein [unclassified Gilliamella]|jgi:membrane-bound lytic murein transglycosylase D|uniref:transglycosylase SLT domain-containing protein n=1 Tax=unclassified Gilliamella TaxID=2685620 RepID=UPI0004DD3FCC|nr:transglycosylase SLT domain-containing protein [Gilliamella apicola]KFA59119.1 Membrane-bound lytic murein transglycosylase D precursor [Gilliamella apicola]
MKKLFIFTILCLILVACQNHGSNTNNSVYQTHNSLSVVASSIKSSGINHILITQNPWQYMLNQIDVNVPENKRVKEERDRLLLNPQAFEVTALRSEPYVYYIINQLRKNRLPVELALIPLIESAYDPLATSSGKAAGLWQFVPITAKEYGLKKNSNFDDRRDLIASTNSAITLLQNLNNRFNGDWLLTLAAYNAGEGRVKKAIEKNQANGLPTNYWSLELPNETMRYVPKILAIIDIVKNSKQYGIKLPDCSYENSLVRIDMSKNISLAKIAQYSDIPLSDLKSFNAGYLKQTVNGPFHLLVPYAYAEKLHKKLQEKNLVTTEITELLQDVPHSTMPIEVKTATIQQSTGINNKNTILHTANTKKQITYQVKAGDSLHSIARNYQVKITDILTWNNMKDSQVKEGDVLTINLINPI